MKALLIVLLSISTVALAVDPLTHELREAIEKKDESKVKALLEKGAPLGDPDLLMREGFGNLAILEVLFQHGLDPSEMNSHLHGIWSRTRNAGDLQFLFDKKLEFPGVWSLLSEWFAVNEENIAVLRANGVDLPGPDFDWEEENGKNEKFAQAMVASGKFPAFAELGLIDPRTFRFEGGSTILHELVRGRYPSAGWGTVEFPEWIGEQAKLLVEEYELDPSIKDDQGNTPLHLIYGSLARHLSHRAPIIFDEEGLHSTVSQLIGLGGSLEVKNREGLTPNDVSKAAAGDPVFLTRLIDARFKEKEERLKGRQELFLASIERQDEKIMRHLLEEGLDPNFGRSSLDSPLVALVSSAELKNRLALLKLIINHGARLPEEADEELNRLRWAYVRSAEIVRLMAENGGVILPDPRLFTDFQLLGRPEEFFREMVKHGLTIPDEDTQFDPEYFDSYEDWVRRVVATSPGALRFLVREGHLTKDFRTKNGQTLLHLLANGRSPSNWQNSPLLDEPGKPEFVAVPTSDLVTLLIEEAGIDPNIPDDAGDTALHVATRGLLHPNEDQANVAEKEDPQWVIDALIQNGARPDLANAGEMTPEKIRVKAAAPVVAGSNDFAFDIYRELLKGEGSVDQNLFFSPYSITTALGMTLAGAEGSTRDQMTKTMRFRLPQRHFHPVLGKMTTRLESAGKEKHYRLAVANRLWPSLGVELVPEFEKLVARDYDARLQLLDFGKSDEAARTINDWVAGNTQQKIKDILSPADVGPNTQMVLTNAIHFKGDWAHPFDPGMTDSLDFSTPEGKKKAKLMHQVLYTRYKKGNGFEVLELPYTSGELSMIVVLPDDLKKWESDLTGDSFREQTSGLNSENVALHFPRLRMTNRMSLKETLSRLGMGKAFEEADFSRMSQSLRASRIGDVIHKAFVEVNEEGTEAAAATAVVIPVSAPRTVTVNRPFLFAIRDNATGCILFLGRVCDPIESE